MVKPWPGYHMLLSISFLCYDIWKLRRWSVLPCWWCRVLFPCKSTYLWTLAFFAVPREKFGDNTYVILWAISLKAFGLNALQLQNFQHFVGFLVSSLPIHTMFTTPASKHCQNATKKAAPSSIKTWFVARCVITTWRLRVVDSRRLLTGSATTFSQYRSDTFLRSHFCHILELSVFYASFAVAANKYDAT